MAAARLKVFLIGGDNQGWALDTERNLARKALENVVDFVASPQQADVVHTVWPEELLENPSLHSILNTKKVVASFSNDPIALFEKVPGLYGHAKNWFCVAQSTDAAEKLRLTQIPFVRQISYVADLGKFRPLDPNSAELTALRNRLEIPKNKYVIGSFQRDSLGANLSLIKPQKGADVFLGLLIGLQRRVGNDFHVLLGGPRRHWLIDHLRKNKISFSFEGKIIEGDDYPQNILSHERICELTNLIDINVISSRWEGAPRAIMETAICRRKVISTPVGIASDVLAPECIFKSLSQGIDILEKDLKTKFLDRFIETYFKKIQREHSLESVAETWKKIYSDVATELSNQGPRDDVKFSVPTFSLPSPRLLQKTLYAVSKVKKKISKKVSKKKTITLWGEMVSGPYGGGSQVLKAMAVELEKRKYKVLNNSYNDSDAHILNSTFFDVAKATHVIRSSQHRPQVIHRIDGPISLYRGKDRNLDEEIFRLNREVCTATAFQCLYSWRESLKMGFDPVNPMIIRNACDPAFFYPPEKGNFKSLDLKKKKIKIISSCWSTNMIKGFGTYKYLDETLDYSKYDYTFVGRSPIEFKNIKLVDAVASRELGQYLREADVFISASLNDPASNALLEAINCGLPVLYVNSGGHSEFVWYAGLGYNTKEEVPAQLEKILNDYASYKACTYSLTIADIVDSYLRVIEGPG